MSCFTSQVDGMTVTEPDPTKHVKYNLGMVLGVDDFTQEFAYLSGRDQWLARDLIGYGTARGLQVTAAKDAKGLRVMVEPGVAVSPKGQMICVPSAQCAYLDQWLSTKAEELKKELQSPPRSVVKVYVVLCYRDCPTDKVPIPGEPCRSEADLTAPSRLTDDFQLELRLKAPKQREEDALRDFVAWLRQIEISDSVASSISLKRFEAEIREAAKPWLSPLTSPISPPLESPPRDFMFGSPPASLQIPASEAFEYMRAAFRIWTMELRPKWIGRRHGCAPDKPGGMSLKEEDCVMLAALNIKVLPTSPPGGFIVAESSTSSVEVDESKRPFLVHLRMLEEWLLCRERQASPANEVVKEREFGRVESAGSSVAYSRADHTHGTPVLPELSGDVGGQIVHAKVTGIQGFPVAETEPAKGQVLTFRVVDGSDIKTGKWLPAELPPPAKPELPKLDGDVTGALDTNKIDKIQGIPINLPKQPRDATVLNGQVLTFRDKGLQLEEVQKQTVNGDFVEHPKGLGQYLIVAAGTIRGDNKNKLSPYNGLVVSKLLPGQMFVTFKGYKPPDETFQYVVKVLPVSNAKVKMPIVSFDGFQRDQGLALKLFDGQEAVSQEILGSLELMIEVSQYFVIR